MRFLLATFSISPTPTITAADVRTAAVREIAYDLTGLVDPGSGKKFNLQP